MIAVIFEVQPTEAGRAAYVDHAAALQPMLERMEGFISVERFQSLADPARLLSLSFWRDEAAVRGWREMGRHRDAQAAGRGGLFHDYRLRVAHVVRDYGLHERAQVPP
ncbi:MAG: antibiotic biosynthesis monooxygenase [Pelomonas sp.]|nr:antibiotic biosynthesis monooxygenase [Roseateles sp.]